MGNNLRKADSRTTLSLLFQCIQSQRAVDFQMICNNLVEPLPMHKYPIEIYTWLAIHSVNLTYQQMKMMTEALKCKYHYLGHPITNYSQSERPPDNLIYELTDTSTINIILSQKSNNVQAICVNAHAIEIAKRIRQSIYPRFKLQTAVIDLLIQTLEELINITRLVSPPTKLQSQLQVGNSNKIDMTNLDFKALSNLTPQKLTLISGLSIYHMFTLQSVFANLDEICALVPLLTRWSVLNSVNARAETKKYMGLVYINGDYNWVQTNKKSYRDDNLKRRLLYQPLIRLAGMRPLTLAYLIKFDLFLNRKFNFNLDLKVINKVIEILTNLTPCGRTNLTPCVEDQP